MNICLLSKSQLKGTGGIETYTEMLSNAFIDLGHNVHIITTSKDSNQDIEHKYQKKGIKIHKVNFEFVSFRGGWRLDRIFPASLFMYSYLVNRKIRDLIREYDIDIVETPNRAFGGLIYSFNKRIPLVVRLHGGILVDKILKLSNHPTRDIFIRRFENSLILNADSITSPSESITQIISRSYGVKRYIETIPNPVDLTGFYPHSEEATTPTILYVGRLQELKGIFVLAKAIPKVLAVLPNVNFIFVGPDSSHGKGNRSCREILCERIKNKRVSFYPEVCSKELLKLYNKAWVCVFPSFYESFGMVALEAMACAKPIVATSVGGFAEIINNNINGLLVQPKNADSLAESIIYLIKNKTERNRLGLNALKTVENKYNLVKVAGFTIKLYEKTIENFKKYGKRYA